MRFPLAILSLMLVAALVRPAASEETAPELTCELAAEAAWSEWHTVLVLPCEHRGQDTLVLTEWLVHTLRKTSHWTIVSPYRAEVTARELGFEYRPAMQADEVERLAAAFGADGLVRALITDDFTNMWNLRTEARLELSETGGALPLGACRGSKMAMNLFNLHQYGDEAIEEAAKQLVEVRRQLQAKRIEQ